MAECVEVALLHDCGPYLCGQVGAANIEQKDKLDFVLVEFAKSGGGYIKHQSPRTGC